MRRAADGSAEPEPDDEAGPEDAGRHGQGAGGVEERGGGGQRGRGTVTVKISGELELKELRIDPEAVDPEDVDMLQDMVQAAVNEAIRSAQELAASKMNAAAGGLAGPGGLGGLGIPGL